MTSVAKEVRAAGPGMLPGFRDRVSTSFAEAFGRSARPVAPEAVGVQAARMGV